MTRRTVGIAIIAGVGLLLALFLLARWVQPPDRQPQRKKNPFLVFSENQTPKVFSAEFPPARPSPSPPPSPTPPDASFLTELEKDMNALNASIQATKQRIASDIQKAAAGIPQTGNVNFNPTQEVVRELDFSGWPPDVIQSVMQRYGMRIERRYVSNFTPNTFLSRATVPDNKHFYAGHGAAPGIYEVFELTPAALARMSSLEEQELIKRGWQPEQCVTSRVVFGIVRQPNGGYDLGVLLMESQYLQ